MSNDDSESEWLLIVGVAIVLWGLGVFRWLWRGFESHAWLFGFMAFTFGFFMILAKFGPRLETLYWERQRRLEVKRERLEEEKENLKIKIQFQQATRRHAQYEKEITRPVVEPEKPALEPKNKIREKTTDEIKDEIIGNLFKRY